MKALLKQSCCSGAVKKLQESETQNGVNKVWLTDQKLDGKEENFFVTAQTCQASASGL